jgi:membrane-bound serine protease (ClpP class)
MLIEINGTISVGTADFVNRSLRDAAAGGMALLVIRLDTPGGLVAATREMIKDILASSVPVAVFVAPSGARAASAGTYISYAAHFSAMAPGTHLGAATPIQIGGPGLPTSPSQNPGTEDRSKDAQTAIERKTLNDAISYIRGLAELRGRNAEWAEKAVREAATLTASDALKENVIDVIAGDTGELLTKLDGRRYGTPSGESRLDVRNATVLPIQPGWRTQFISFITDPNIAFILLMIGVYGILFEFWSPGLAGPGIVGSISLVTALAALSTLPINIAGLALLGLGVALMAGEALAPGVGLLGLGGVVAFGLGAVFLFDPSGFDVEFQIAWPVILSATITSALLLIGLLGFVIRVRHSKVVTGAEQMVGMIGRTATWPAGGQDGQVLVHGELWSAHAPAPLTAGQRVKVVGREDLKLLVVSIDDERSPP